MKLRGRKIYIACVVLIALLSGCAGPYPIQIGTGFSLVTVYRPQVSVWMAPSATNSFSDAAAVPRDADSQTIRPSQRGVSVFFDNVISFPNGGGTAASNNVPVSFSFAQ